MKSKKAMTVLIMTASFFIPCTALAQTGQFFDDFGASCKAIAMGQAFTAVADDYGTAYYNPAGLTQLRSPMALTIGYFCAKPNAKADFASGPDRYDNDMPLHLSSHKSSHGAIIGTASDLDIPSLIEAYPWFRRLALGIVFWLDLPYMLNYEIGPENYRPHFLRYDEGFALMSMVFSLAFEVTPWFSVGAGGFLSQKTYSKQDVFSDQSASPPL